MHYAQQITENCLRVAKASPSLSEAKTAIRKLLGKMPSAEHRLAERQFRWRCLQEYREALKQGSVQADFWLGLSLNT